VTPRLGACTIDIGMALWHCNINIFFFLCDATSQILAVASSRKRVVHVACRTLAWEVAKANLFHKSKTGGRYRCDANFRGSLWTRHTLRDRRGPWDFVGESLAFVLRRRSITHTVALKRLPKRYPTATSDCPDAVLRFKRATGGPPGGDSGDARGLISCARLQPPALDLHAPLLLCAGIRAGPWRVLSTRLQAHEP